MDKTSWGFCNPLCPYYDEVSEKVRDDWNFPQEYIDYINGNRPFKQYTVGDPISNLFEPCYEKVCTEVIYLSSTTR